MTGEKYIVEGNVVRKLETAPSYKPQREPERRPRPQRQPKPKTDVFSIVVIFAAVAVSLYICFTYLQKQGQVKAVSDNIVTLESQVIDLESENVQAREMATAKIDLPQILEEATKRLGMVHAKESQIYTYSISKDNQVKQYTDIQAK